MVLFSERMWLSPCSLQIRDGDGLCFQRNHKGHQHKKVDQMHVHADLTGLFAHRPVFWQRLFRLVFLPIPLPHRLDTGQSESYFPGDFCRDNQADDINQQRLPAGLPAAICGVVVDGVEANPGYSCMFLAGRR